MTAHPYRFGSRDNFTISADVAAAVLLVKGERLLSVGSE